MTIRFDEHTALWPVSLIAFGLILVGHRHIGRWVLERIDRTLCRISNDISDT